MRTPERLSRPVLVVWPSRARGGNRRRRDFGDTPLSTNRRLATGKAQYVIFEMQYGCSLLRIRVRRTLK